MITQVFKYCISDLPEYTGGAEITNYEVNWMPVSDGSDAHAQIGYTGNKAECTIGELSPGTAYSFAVRAANQIGVREAFQFFETFQLH